MANQELELFVHSEGAKPKVVSEAPGEVLRDVLVRSGFIRPEQGEILIFVGECEEALGEAEETEEGADRHVPVEAGLTLEVLEHGAGIKRLGHPAHAKDQRSISVAQAVGVAVASHLRCRHDTTTGIPKMQTKPVS